MTTPASKTKTTPDGSGAPTRASQVNLAGGPVAAKKPGGDKRDAIIEAALTLFVERGFYGTAVPEIADKAGVGAGTIYRYFDSKEALVNAIYRQEKLRFGHFVIDGFPATAATRDQFRMLWNRMVKFTLAHPDSFVFMEMHHHARYLDAESRTVEARMLDLFIRVIENAQARHELKSCLPRLMIGMVMGAFIGVIRSCVEVDMPLEKADWALAEQCMWEACRV